MHARNRYLLLSLLLVLLAFGLRVTAIADKTMWWDETWSVWTSQHDFADTTEITASDVHPPLYQWTLFAWIRLAGISEFAVRTLSALIGTMTVAVVISLTRRISGNKSTALLAAFFVATSIFHIHWSQETRMYIMAAFFATMTVYAYLRIDEKLSKWWALLIISALGAALAQYLGGLMLVILCLHWLIFRHNYSRDFHRLWLRAMIVIALIFSVWMLYAIGLIRSSEGTTEFSPLFVFELAATLLAVGKSTALADYRLPVLLFMVIYVVGIALYVRINRKNSTLIVLVAIFPPLVIYLLSLPFTPFYSPKPEARYFVIFAPVVYVGLGLALAQWWRLHRIIGSFLIVIMFIVFGKAYLDELDSRYFQDDYAMMMGAIDILAQDDDPVFFISGGRFPLIYYNLDRMTDGQSQLNIQEIPSSGDNINAIMERTIGTIPYFWLIEIEAHLGDSDGLRQAWIDERYQRVYFTAVAYNGISLYAREGVEIPNPRQTLPPVITEARPGDYVRIGVPPRHVALFYDNQMIITRAPQETWQLIEFDVYPAYPPGEYYLHIGDQYFAFDVTHSQSRPQNPPQNIDVSFGEMHLMGYDIADKTLKPGDTLDVTLYWRADQYPTEDYTVFFQLIGPFNPATGNPVWAQLDSYPADTPSTLWWSGLSAYDRRQVTIPDDMPAGTHSIVLGLYNLQTGERLLTSDGNDHIVIDGIEVGD